MRVFHLKYQILLLCMLTSIFLFTESVLAQELGLFRLRRWHGSMLFRLQREKRIAVKISRERAYSGRFILRNSGFFVNPDILNFEWSGDVGLFLQQFITKEIQRDTRGRLLGHNLTASLFQSNINSLIFLWNQNANIITLDENGRTSYDVNTLQATLNMRGKKLPSRLHISWHDLWEEWDRVGFNTTRNQVRKTLQYKGKREEENSIFNVDYDFVDILDRIRTKSSYSKHTAYLRLRHAFGKNQANKLDSKFNLFILNGLSNHKNARLNQSLELQHLPSFTSQYHHALSISNSANSGTSIQNSAYAAIRHSLFASLNSNFGVGGSYATLQNGQAYTYSVSGGISYSKKIPLSGVFQIGYSLGYSVNDNQIKSTEKVVVSERHVFFGAFPVILHERNIMLSTVVVFSRDGQMIFEEGEDKDYTLKVIGNRVEIHRSVLGRIRDDKVILVDYNFQTLPAMRYSTNSKVFNTGLNFGWLSLTYGVNRHDQNILNGDPEYLPSLQDLYTKIAQIKMSVRGETAGTSLLAEHKLYKSTTLDFKAVAFRHSFFLRPFRSLSLSNNFTISLLNHNRENLDINVYAVRTELNWRPSSSFIFSGYFKYNIRKETLQSDERNIEYGGTIQRFWRIIRILLRYEKRKWEFEPQFINERRFTVEVERIF